MEDYSRQRHEEAGYEFVNSPHITKATLFETSGHLDWFADGMFPPMHFDDEGGEGGQDYYLKPMNCPFHVLIYRSRMRSYRELPLRLFEFGTVYRYEKSGVIHGLTRVRGLTMDDSHIFTTKEQMAEELVVAARLRPRPARRLRPERLLPRAVHEAAREGGRHRRGVGRRPRRRCARPLPTKDLELVLDEGGGAFYGPKISRAGPRRHRSHLADVHDPARLPDCRSASASSTSAPTTSATSRS